MPSSSSASIIRFLEEETVGVTPSTGPQVYRTTGGSLAQTTQSSESKELRSDRGRSDSVLVSGSVGGDINVELSYKTHDTFFEALLANEFVTAGTNNIKTIADCAFNSTTDVISSAGAALPAMVVNQWFKITGASEASNNGIYKVSSSVAPTTSAISVDTTVKAVGATATAASTVISQGRLKQGNSALRSFTIEREIEDAAKFFTWKGCFVSSAKLNFAVGSEINGSFGFLGQSSEVTGSTTGFTGIASVVAATTTPLFNSVTNSVVLVDGVSMGDSCIESLSLDINASMRERRCIGSGLTAASIAADQFKISGTCKVFFGSDASATLYGKQIQDLPFTLSVLVTDANGMAYVFGIPKAKLTACKVDGGSLGSDVMLDISFDAVTDPTLATMFYIDRLGTLA